MPPRIIALIFAILWFHSSLLRADELRTLTGKNIVGTVSNLAENEITLKTETDSVTTPLTQVLSLDLQAVRELPASLAYIRVQLLDDSMLRCQSITYRQKDADLKLLSGTVVRIPISAIVSVLRDAQDAGISRSWDQISRQKARRDRIFVLRDSELNPLEGTLGDIDAAKQTIQFKRDDAASITLPFGKLQGMLFYRTDVVAESPLCRVIDQEGSTLIACKLNVKGDLWQVTTSFGMVVDYNKKSVAKLDFNFGRLTYLSDLGPLVIPSPWLGDFSPMRKDLNLDGSPITLSNRQYSKGLSIYAGVELQYNLAGKYKEFKALLGADARIAEEGQGQVTMTIFCDGEKRFSEIVSTQTPRPLAINVKDINTLRIVVTGQDFTNLSGHATLADARISQ